MNALSYALLADLILVLHVAFVIFVVAGAAAIPVGKWRRWRWVFNPCFRLAHLTAMGVVATQAWLGAACPSTILENWLRRQTQESAYKEGFIEYWLGRLIYYQAPSWVFIAVYTLFCLVILALWRYAPPRWPKKKSK